MLCHVIFASNSSLHYSTVQCGSSGHVIPTLWLFGMVLLKYPPPWPVFYVVEQQDWQTLQSIITSHCLPGSRFWLDRWSTYRNLNKLGNIHKTLNHWQLFIFIPCSTVIRYNYRFHAKFFVSFKHSGPSSIFILSFVISRSLYF